MNFEYSEEQILLKESVARWVQDNYSFDQRHVFAQSEQGFGRDNWSTFAELGWLSVPFSEEFGGFGGSVVDVSAIMQEFGNALLLEPVFPSVIMFGGLLEKAGNAELNQQIIPQIIDGSLLGAVAMYEPHARFDMSNIATTASADGDHYLLSGSKSFVLGGAHADKIIVLARTSGEQSAEQGISLFLLDTHAKGVSKSDYTLMDGQHVADLELDKVAGILLGELDGGYAPISAMMQDAHVALCAEAVGIMEKLNKTTLEYTKTRKQFGTVISSFQALQHRMVDTFMSQEQAKSLLVGTLCELSDETTSPERATKLVNALRTLVAKAGKHIGDEAIHLHGGMGLTDELDVGHYVKRLMMINLMFGNGDFFQNQFNRVAYG